MSSRETAPADPLVRTIAGALVWGASFLFALTLFLTARRLFKFVPPTDPVAIGAVTIAGASKLRDYLVGIFYYALVPAATVLFAHGGPKLFARLRGETLPAIAAFTLPYFFAPFFYLTTGKEGWGLLLPPILSLLATRAIVLHRTRRWLREIFAPALAPAHALLVTEGLAWILFRALATGKRIAHIPTLFLEIVFILFFVALYWTLALFLARLGNLLGGIDTGAALQRIAAGASPFLLLPIAALTPLEPRWAIVAALAVAAAAIATLRTPIPAATLRRLLAWAAIPALLFVMSYAASASQMQWVDLFHRGESLGPASDYLRGKTPYRDVFVLHGMLEDGLLDAWLMEIFGRRAEVAVTRAIVVSALTIPALWCLGLVLFDSIPLAALVALASFMTYLENQRALLEIVVVALLVAGLRRARVGLIAAAGAVAALALFFSLEIGIYSIVAGAASLLLLRRRALAAFLAGVAAGAAPFLLYLANGGALGEFFATSFATIPRIIDATWSLPFPDLAGWLRTDLTLPAVAGFILSDRIAYILNPLVIGAALAVLAARFVRTRRLEGDAALAVITLFALVTQRSALGRADFRHQYFSAFLFVPILVVLLAMAARSLREIWNGDGRGAKAFVVLLALLAAPALFVALWVPDLLNARIDAIAGYRARVGARDPAGAATRERIGAVGSEIARLTPPDAPIFDFSNQPAFYFYASRPNPTRFYQVPILSPLPLQTEAIETLERSKPRVVLRRSPDGYDRFDGLANELRAPALAAYLGAHYRFHRKLHGVEIWTRIPGRPFELQRYVREHRLPSRETLAPTDWSIFPSVGSVAGAAGSYWRSDLAIYNPHAEPLPVRLRYVSSAGAIDERLTIAPWSVARWADVVATLFHSPESRGTLRVEHPAERKPIMTVRTYDAARAAHGAIERPLSVGDAATAGTARDELTLAGVAGTGGRRLNIGAINVGDGPLRIRITCRTAEGAAIGEPVDALLEEDVSHLIVDASAALGAPIDESMTTHIRILQGTAIAYASVIDIATGDHQVMQAIPTKGVER